MSVASTSAATGWAAPAGVEPAGVRCIDDERLAALQGVGLDAVEPGRHPDGKATVVSDLRWETPAGRPRSLIAAGWHTDLPDHAGTVTYLGVTYTVSVRTRTNSDITTRTLDSHACRLRRKLTAQGDRFVINVWGVGIPAWGWPIASDERPCRQRGGGVRRPRVGCPRRIGRRRPASRCSGSRSRWGQSSLRSSSTRRLR